MTLRVVMRLDNRRDRPRYVLLSDGDRKCMMRIERGIWKRARAASALIERAYRRRLSRTHKVSPSTLRFNRLRLVKHYLENMP